MLKDFFSQNDIAFLENESLKNHSTFKVGGNADFIAMPKDIKQVSLLLRH